MKSALIFALICMAVGQTAAQRITLVRNGKSNCVILLAPGVTAPMRHGAEELQRFLRQMSGAQLPIIAPEAGWMLDDLPKGTRCLLVIADAEVLAQRGEGPMLGPEEFRIRTLPGDRRNLPQIEISGDHKRGALYGCYAFLEDVLGCRWYTSRISRIPKRRTIVIGPLDIREKPAFEYREPYYTEAFDRDWAVRNRTNGNSQRLDESVGGRIAYGPFVHTFNSLVPPDEYFDTHPEYFSMINGRRMKGYYQLCLTNPDVLRISIERVKQWIRDNPNATIFSVSQNDTGYNCQCDNCKAVEQEEGAPSGVVLRFVNAVADAIAKEYPHVLIDTLAYQWTEDPPKKVRPRPNVRIRLAPISACFGHPLDRCDANRKSFANLSAWAKITDQLYIWHYSTNFANYLQPLPDLDEIAGDIPLFKQHGVVGLFYEGGYASGGGCEGAELKAYLMAKLMWNPNRPVEPIIEEFMQGVYGKAAPYMLQWQNLLHQDVRTKNVHVRIYDPPTAPYLSPAVLDEGTKLFDAAEKAVAGDPVALDAVQRARLALEYVQLMRASPRYTVEGGEYRPTGGARADLARVVAEKIRKYGIGQVREGEPVENFLRRIENTGKSFPVLTLENDALRLEAVPALGGRIIRLVDKATGRNLLREPQPTEAGYPAAGGYEEYSTGEYRSPGWNETYEGAKEGNELRVSARLSNGMALHRIYRLDGGTLHIRTVATNTADSPKTVALRGHPEFAVPTGVTPRVTFRDRSGKEITLDLAREERDRFLRENDLPNGAWTLRLGGLSLTQQFDPAQVSTALLNGTLSGGRVNLELYGVPRELAPKESVVLEQSWRINRANR
jgi:hypothetical protein